MFLIISPITSNLQERTTHQNIAKEISLRPIFFTFMAHCVLLYLIHFEEDASDFLIFWSTHMSQNGERKKIEILRSPSEIAC